MKDTDDLPDSNGAESTVCANGHMLTVGQRFCPTCGSAAQMNTPHTTDSLVATPLTGEALKRHNRVVAWISAGVVVVAGLAIALVLLMSSHGAGSVNTHSQSYQDGYQTWNWDLAGQGISSCDGEFQQWSNAGDNFNEWMAGCTAGSDGLPNGSIPNGY